MKNKRNNAVIFLAITFFLLPVSLSIKQFDILSEIGKIMYYLALFIILPVSNIYYLICWFNLNDGEHHLFWGYRSDYGWLLILSQIVFVLGLIFLI